MNKHKKMRKKRRLFHNQGGRCYYCNCQMRLVKGIPGSPLPSMATFEHLDDKFSPHRGQRTGQVRVVLACWKCNNEKGAEAEAAQPIEELRRRCQNTADATHVASLSSEATMNSKGCDAKITS